MSRWASSISPDARSERWWIISRRIAKKNCAPARPSRARIATLALHLNGRPAAGFASEGQQRSVTLAMKIAQARALEQAKGEPPLLLIDDVFGELDPVRRRVLLNSFPPEAQRIITTTHLDWAGRSGQKRMSGRSSRLRVVRRA